MCCGARSPTVRELTNDIGLRVDAGTTGLACGFARTDRPMIVRRRKGQVLDLATWDRPVQPS